MFISERTSPTGGGWGGVYRGACRYHHLTKYHQCHDQNIGGWAGAPPPPRQGLAYIYPRNPTLIRCPDCIGTILRHTHTQGHHQVTEHEMKSNEVMPSLVQCLKLHVRLSQVHSPHLQIPASVGTGIIQFTVVYLSYLLTLLLAMLLFP